MGGSAARLICPGVAGTWKDLTDNVNFMASNLTGQVRNIAEVTTTVARGDLSRKITVDVKGEILELKNTINTMVDQLNAFAGEVTRVVHEVRRQAPVGIYLVGWFDKTKWDTTDDRRRRAPNCTLLEAQARLDGQAQALPAGSLVQALVLDCHAP